MDYVYLLILLLIQALAIFGMYWLYNRQRTLRNVLPLELHKEHKQMRILSVVAGDDLNIKEIEKGLYSTDLNYTLLPYKAVNQDSLLAELSKNVTIFELSTHGLNGQFRLGNTVLPVSWLSRALVSSKALECVLLLYCNSSLDMDILDAPGRFVVGLVDDVSDESCVIFTRQFYYYLNKKYSYPEAFEAARLHLVPKEFRRFVYKYD